MEYVSVKNFTSLQHHSIKGAAWIKLYTSITDDYELSILPEQSRLLYFCLLTLAAILGNKIPTDRRWLADRLHLPELRTESIELLIKSGFLLHYDGSERGAVITDEPTQVASDANIVVPNNAPAKKARTVDPIDFYSDPNFSRFWDAYPKKESKVRASMAWIQLVKKGVITDQVVENILAAIDRQRMSDGWTKEKGKYIPLPSSWINARRWEDESAQPHGRSTHIKLAI